MPKFRIPVRWEMYGTKEIEAETVEAAADKALNEVKLSDFDASYVEGSFEIDWEGIPASN